MSLAHLPLLKLQAIFSAIQHAGGECRLVGGCVRDSLVGAIPKDIDVATTLLPEHSMSVLRECGFTCIPTNMRYGTITVIQDDFYCEITTLRSDIKTYGRQAEVKFTVDWQEDAARRDFTFNAIYMSLDGKVYDFWGGVEDLKQRKVRFVGEPRQRIAEDYLRILRYFRFYSYFGGEQIDAPSLQACAEAKECLLQLSAERIRAELLKICAASHVAAALQLMLQNAILPIIIPEIKVLQTLPKSFRPSQDPLINIAALFCLAHVPPIEVRTALLRLRFSNAERALISKLYRFYHQASLSEESLQLLFLEMGSESFHCFGTLLQVLGQLSDEYLNFMPWPEPQLKPCDLVELGYKGVDIAATYDKIKEIWLQHRGIITREQLLKQILIDH
jgi:poly(A) polymerase